MLHLLKRSLTLAEVIKQAVERLPRAVEDLVCLNRIALFPMRSPDVQLLATSSYVSGEDRVPSDHPIRKLCGLMDSILGELHLCHDSCPLH